MTTAKRLWLLATAAALAGTGLALQPPSLQARARMSARASMPGPSRIMKARSGSGVRSPTAATPTRSLISPRPISKAENLQRAGAFKFRGAYNAVASLDPQERERGVATVSSGNHAQALALAARLHEVPAVILMPDDAPAGKLAATQGYGAEIVPFDRYGRGSGGAAGRARGRARPGAHPPV